MSSAEKVWFITGSNSGFGRSLTEAVLKKGDKAVATTRHPEEIEDLVIQYADRVKAVTLDITKSDNPPLHLVLGEDALQATRKKIESLQQELAEWEEITLSTSFSDAKSVSLS